MQLRQGPKPRPPGPRMSLFSHPQALPLALERAFKTPSRCEPHSESCLPVSVFARLHPASTLYKGTSALGRPVFPSHCSRDQPCMKADTLVLFFPLLLPEMLPHPWLQVLAHSGWTCLYEDTCSGNAHKETLPRFSKRSVLSISK